MITDTHHTLACTVRVLPPEEWSRLEGLPFAEGGLPNPEWTVVLVAETPEGRIVGVWAALTQVFLDGLWTAPEYRGTTRIAMKLLRGMTQMLRELGVTRSYALIESTDILCLAQKAGFTRIRGDVCVLQTEGES